MDVWKMDNIRGIVGGGGTTSKQHMHPWNQKLWLFKIIFIPSVFWTFGYLVTWTVRKLRNRVQTRSERTATWRNTFCSPRNFVLRKKKNAEPPGTSHSRRARPTINSVWKRSQELRCEWLGKHPRCCSTEITKSFCCCCGGFNVLPVLADGAREQIRRADPTRKLLLKLKIAIKIKY